MIKNSEISLYVDALIVEAIVSDRLLEKKAQGADVGNILNSIKGYVETHIDPDKPAESVLNILAPGAIFMVFRAMGLGKIGGLLGLAASVFHIDVGGIMKSVYESVKNMVSKGGKTTSSQVNEVVSQAVDANTKPPSEESIAETQQKLQSQPSLFDVGNAEASLDYSRKFHKNYVNIEVRKAKMIRLAVINYENSLHKQADASMWEKFKSFFTGKDAVKNYSHTQTTLSGIIKRVLGFFVGVVLASAGFLVVGDIINSMLGRASGLTGTLEKGKPVPGSGVSDAPRMSAPPIPKSTQTKFPLNSSYVEENYPDNVRWTERYTSTRHGIEDMVLDFAEDVYSGLKDKDNLITSSPQFSKTIDILLFHNQSHIGHNIVFIPTNIYHSKKEIVDTFIDDVAKRA